MKIINIWITGHRESKFSKTSNIKNNLNKFLDLFFIRNKLSNHDNIIFNLGGANGIDNWVWEYCINKWIKYNLYLPFKDTNIQIKWWNSIQIKLYNKILENSNKIFYWNWYFDRNRKIVDNSDIIICALQKNISHSWTWYTVNYAKKKKLHIYNILDSDLI